MAPPFKVNMKCRICKHRSSVFGDVCPICLSMGLTCRQCGILEVPVRRGQVYCKKCEESMPKCHHKECQRQDGMQRVFLLKENKQVSFCNKHFEEFYNKPHQNHSYKPNPTLWHHMQYEKKGQVYFGVEIETEASSKHAPDVGNSEYYSRAIIAQLRSEFFYYKRDGSLDSSGVEIVSHPFTFEFLKKRGWREFSRVCSGFTKAGYSSFASGRCGMHVHVSKEAFPGNLYDHAKRWFYANKQNLIKLSQRGGDNNYCSYDPNQGGRGAIAMREQTVEFRLFRGNLKPKRVLKNIEFCHAFIKYMNDGGMKFTKHTTDQTKGFAEFSEFVSSRKDEYPYLSEFLENEMGSKQLSEKEDNDVRDIVLAEFDECDRRHSGKLLEEKQQRSGIPIRQRRQSSLQKAVL